MDSLEQDIHAAATRLGLSESDWKRCDKSESVDVVAYIERDFVEGSPRVWWLSLKNRPSSTEHTPQELDRVLKQIGGGSVYFLPDPDDGTPVPVFRACAGCINSLLNEMYYFEFYVLSANREWLISANDHNELLVSHR